MINFNSISQSLTELIESTGDRALALNLKLIRQEVLTLKHDMIQKLATLNACIED